MVSPVFKIALTEYVHPTYPVGGIYHAGDIFKSGK